MNCKELNCQNPKFCREMCRSHYAKWRRVNPEAVFQHYERNKGLACAVESCNRAALNKKMCRQHYRRWCKAGDDFDRSPIKQKQAPGSEWESAGYMYVRNLKLGKAQLKQRAVMEELLKRPLHKSEHVHHKNGIKTDNRSENLELWSTYHPSGQRIEDLLSWAKEIIARYG